MWLLWNEIDGRWIDQEPEISLCDDLLDICEKVERNNVIYKHLNENLKPYDTIYKQSYEIQFPPNPIEIDETGNN